MGEAIRTAFYESGTLGIDLQPSGLADAAHAQAKRFAAVGVQRAIGIKTGIAPPRENAKSEVKDLAFRGF